MTARALLGPQYRLPSLAECLERLGIAGPLAVVTAGWQEREGEIGELRAHVGRPVTDLGLYRRAEAVQADDPSLAAALRARQAELQERQDLYRVRLGALLEALAALDADDDDSAARRAARRAVLGDVRRLDRAHLADTARVHAAFEHRERPRRRAALAPHLAELARELDRSAALLIAGGHVAVLLNRLRLFGLLDLARQRPVLGWSAGAMALTERVVLFHDHPPQGAAHPEVLETGLGLVPDVVALPHATDRLALDRPAHLARLARRFAPARLLTLDHGTYVAWSGHQPPIVHGVARVSRRGALAGLVP